MLAQRLVELQVFKLKLHNCTLLFINYESSRHIDYHSALLYGEKLTPFPNFQFPKLSVTIFNK